MTSQALRLSDLERGHTIHQHAMPNIRWSSLSALVTICTILSFASGGDAETLDYVAYVAKDGQGGRACYVLECGGGLAQDVITTVGQVLYSIA